MYKPRGLLQRGVLPKNNEYKNRLIVNKYKKERDYMLFDY